MAFVAKSQAIATIRLTGAAMGQAHFVATKTPDSSTGLEQPCGNFTQADVVREMAVSRNGISFEIWVDSKYLCSAEADLSKVELVWGKVSFLTPFTFWTYNIDGDIDEPAEPTER